MKVPGVTIEPNKKVEKYFQSALKRVRYPSWHFEKYLKAERTVSAERDEHII